MPSNARKKAWLMFGSPPGEIIISKSLIYQGMTFLNCSNYDISKLP